MANIYEYSQPGSPGNSVTVYEIEDEELVKQGVERFHMSISGCTFTVPADARHFAARIIAAAQVMEKAQKEAHHG